MPKKLTAKADKKKVHKKAKSAARKRARDERPRPRAMAWHERPAGITARRAARIVRFAALAADATCLELPAAIALVRGCLGGELVDLGTKLGDLFPEPDARAQFCQCVANGAGVSRAQIPCGEGTTLLEVVDAIAC